MSGLYQALWRVRDYLSAGGPLMLPLAFVSLWLWVLIVFKLLEIYGFWRTGLQFDPLRAGWRAWAWELFTRGGDRRLEEALLKAPAAKLDRHVATILVLAAVAPLIGLLGTVTGMIRTFQVINIHGTGHAQALAGGVSEALITTQTGLVVALPGLFLGNFIRRRVERLKGSLSRFGPAPRPKGETC